MFKPRIPQLFWGRVLHWSIRSCDCCQISNGLFLFTFISTKKSFNTNCFFYKQKFIQILSGDMLQVHENNKRSWFDMCWLQKERAYALRRHFQQQSFLFTWLRQFVVIVLFWDSINNILAEKPHSMNLGLILVFVSF